MKRGECWDVRVWPYPDEDMNERWAWACRCGSHGHGYKSEDDARSGAQPHLEKSRGN